MRLRLCFALLLVAGLSTASAKEMIRADPSDFPALRKEIEKDIKSDGYSELTRTQREEVVAALDRMEETLAGVESVQSLSDSKKTQLFNDQELVNTVLTRAEADSRTICRKEQRTGSHRLNQNCRTVGEIRRTREDAKLQLMKNQTIRRAAPGEPGG